MTDKLSFRIKAQEGQIIMEAACREMEPRCVSTEWLWGYLGNLGLQVPVFHLQVTLLTQRRGQGRVLGVEQSLQVFEPLQRSGQLRLLLGVSVEMKSVR